MEDTDEQDILSQERHIKVLGKIIGTYVGGWDELDYMNLVFYEAKLNEEGLKVLPNFPTMKNRYDISINYDEGTAQVTEFLIEKPLKESDYKTHDLKFQW